MLDTSTANTIIVKTPSKTYPIYLSGNASCGDWLATLSRHLKGSRVVILTSPRVKKFCLPILQKELRRQKSKLKSFSWQMAKLKKT